MKNSVQRKLEKMKKKLQVLYCRENAIDLSYGLSVGGLFGGALFGAGTAATIMYLVGGWLTFIPIGLLFIVGCLAAGVGLGLSVCRFIPKGITSAMIDSLDKKIEKFKLLHADELAQSDSKDKETTLDPIQDKINEHVEKIDALTSEKIEAICNGDKKLEKSINMEIKEVTRLIKRMIKIKQLEIDMRAKQTANDKKLTEIDNYVDIMDV